MRLELPDAETKGFTSQELRLELACALYARGRVGKVRGAELAGVDFFAFQGALAERGVPMYTSDMLEQDIQSLNKLFPE
jgi:predicted HTH domain antitoxin